MAFGPLPPFMPKRNKDGTFSAICTICFQTVGRVRIETELRCLQEAHVCVPSPLTVSHQTRQELN
jgi:hypothetical protein